MQRIFGLASVGKMDFYYNDFHPSSHIIMMDLYTDDEEENVWIHMYTIPPT